MPDATPSDTIRPAITRLVLDHPWLAGLVLRLDYIPDNAIPTMATDGKNVYYSPKYCESLSRDEIVGVLGHEAMHCAMRHAARRVGRDHERWNCACDYAINLLLLEAGLTLPADCLRDNKYAGMSSEAIYDALPAQSGKHDCQLIPSESSPADAIDSQVALAAALHAAKKAGKLSASADRYLDEAATPKVPWRELLAWHMRAYIGADDYSWRRPNRRGLGIDSYLPSTISQSVECLVICIDTSGSMSREDISIAVSEVRYAAALTKKIIIIEADAEVKSHTEIASADEYNPKSVKGGGGTDFVPALRAAVDHNPNLIVYITDLEAPVPAYPGLPTLWITRSNNVSPIGHTIKMED